MNSVGTGYANYGLTLAASTMVPLQVRKRKHDVIDSGYVAQLY